MNRLTPLLFALTVAAGSCLPTRAATNVLFSTAFSAAQGYNYRYELAGQNGWVKSTTSDGGNGIITNFAGSDAAYVGLFPLEPAKDFISLWKPVNYAPLMASNPVVTFTTRLAIIDSKAGERDYFSWSVYNTNADRLLTVEFDNYALGVNYYGAGDNPILVDTGVLFTNDVVYTFKLRLELASNRWSAWLDDAVLATNVPLAPGNLGRSVGDVDAEWLVYDVANPGDNFMIFDDYKLTAETGLTQPVQPARLQPLGETANGLFTLRVTGETGARYAVEGSSNLATWTALRTNTVADGYFDFIDSSSPPSGRFYRARWVP